VAFGVDGSRALVLLLMDLQHYGYLISQLSWLWLFALGLLGLRSGMFPRWLSFLLMIGTVCYIADALVRFLAPSFADTSAATFLLPEILCEVALLAFLLAKGVMCGHRVGSYVPQKAPQTAPPTGGSNVPARVPHRLAAHGRPARACDVRRVSTLFRDTSCRSDRPTCSASGTSSWESASP
jgi:hypothetical protein